MKFEAKKNLGAGRLYAKGYSTVGYIRGNKVAKQSDVQPGDLLIGVDHKRQTEFMVEVVVNPNPLNITLIHARPVQTKVYKKTGLEVKPVKNAEQAAYLISELQYQEFWHAQPNKSKAA